MLPDQKQNTELLKKNVREMPMDLRLPDYCPRQADTTELSLLMQEFQL